jgi:hypothetical protein
VFLLLMPGVFLQKRRVGLSSQTSPVSDTWHSFSPLMSHGRGSYGLMCQVKGFRWDSKIRQGQACLRARTQELTAQWGEPARMSQVGWGCDSSGRVPA